MKLETTRIGIKYLRSKIVERAWIPMSALPSGHPSQTRCAQIWNRFWYQAGARMEPRGRVPVEAQLYGEE